MILKKPLLGSQQSNFLLCHLLLPTNFSGTWFFVECRKSLFTRFYNHRETNVIPEEETRLSDAKKKRDVVLKEQRQLEQAIKESNEKSPGKRQQADVNKVRLSKFYNVLINLGVKKVKKPKTPSPMYV